MVETFELSCSPAPEECALVKSELHVAKARPEKVALSPEEEAEAGKRLAILQPLIDFEIDQQTVPRDQLHLDLGLRLPDGQRVTNATTMAKSLAHTHERAEATIWNWYRAYRKHGKFGLVRQARSDKGKSPFFESHP